MTIVLDNPNAINAFHLLSQYHACKLQLLGMRHSSGRSIIAHVKRTHGFKGNNQAVVDQFKAMLTEQGILKGGN